MSNETRGLVNPTVDALNGMGVWAIRINSGKVKTRGGYFQGAPTGTPDILGALRGGKMFGLEGKKGNGVLSPAQLKWRAWAARYGVLFGEFRTIGEAIQIVNAWRKEHQ